jgi:hypothetical protein
MSKRIGSLLAVVMGMLLVPISGVSHAARLAPPDFVPGPGTYTADTTTLVLSGPSTTIFGTAVGGVAVFKFHNVLIQNGVTINALGSRPLRFSASGSLVVEGLIDGSGTSATDFTAGPNQGGPGGGRGGADGTHPGGGPGGGGVGDDLHNGGGGGGFGGVGARGGVDTSGTGGAGGVSNGNLNVALRGGSGGGGGSNTGGGGGGGGIALFGRSVTVSGTGEVRANGGDGACGGNGAAGGGSGGGIIVHGGTVQVNGLLSATGGDGGAGGCCGDGGGGAGGRIAYQYVKLVASGTRHVTGGATGTVSTGGLCSTAGNSPDPTGANGKVTKVKAPDTAITGVLVNSGLHKATFKFKAIGSATGFQCALKKPHKVAIFKACSSPKTYLNLGVGLYTFRVRAFGPGGTDPTPAAKSFRIT